MPHPFLNIDDRMHLCIGGFAPLRTPFTQTLWIKGRKTFGSWVAKPLDNRVSKPLDNRVSKPLDNRVSKPLDKILSTSSKKEDIKMDEQIKIKILKSFDHGLQKHFYKNKEGH
jgi:hypothetical protein